MLANPLRINQIDYDFLDKKFATLIVKIVSFVRNSQGFVRNSQAFVTICKASLFSNSPGQSYHF